jgi:hypothetical protein
MILEITKWNAYSALLFNQQLKIDFSHEKPDFQTGA